MKVTQHHQTSASVERGLSRREMLSGASLAALGLAAVGGLAAEPAAEPKSDSSKHSEQSGELEDFVYDLEGSSSGWKGAGGSAVEATVEEFPVSQSIAGVSMRLNPGAFRELHWHSIAAEWAYILEGHVRTTIISPDGTSATDTFEVGDIWYFPKGHGHMLQCAGDKPCHFLLAFDSGHFSEFGTFSVTDWVSHTRSDIITRDTGIPGDALGKLPRKELYIGTGPIAGLEPPPNIDPAIGWSQTPHKFSLLRKHPREFPGGSLRVVTQKDFPINSTLTSALMIVEPGAFRELHWHPNADEWHYVISGSGQVTLFGSHGRVRTMDYRRGNVAFIKQGYGHFIENSGTEELKVLILFNAPEYQEIALSTWLAANSPQLVADHFGLDVRQAADLPVRKRGVFADPLEKSHPG